MSRATDAERLREALETMRRHAERKCRCGGEGRCLAALFSYAIRELGKLNTREGRTLTAEWLRIAGQCPRDPRCVKPPRHQGGCYRPTRRPR